MALWSVDVGNLEFSNGNVFFIAVNTEINGTNVGFNSHYFTIPILAAASSGVFVKSFLPTTVITSSIFGVTQTVFQNATAASTPSLADSSTTSPTTSRYDTSGLGTDAAAGLGAGVTIGTLLMLSVAAYSWWQYQKKKAKEAPAHDQRSASPVLTNGEKSGFPLSTELDAEDKRVSELPPEDIRRELETEERRGEMDAIEPQSNVPPVEMPTEVHGEEFRNSQVRVSRWSWEGAIESLDRGKPGTKRS